MALSVLRSSICRIGRGGATSSIMWQSFPMATTAHEQMKKYWEKNEKLGRPMAPWLPYRWHFPMMTSLTHRFTGITMGVVLYGAAVGMFATSTDFPTALEALKGLHAPAAVWFSVKATCAFPLCYHYLNGVRHLYWDYKGGYEMATQHKTGYAVFTAATLLSLLFASAAYLQC